MKWWRKVMKDEDKGIAVDSRQQQMIAQKENWYNYNNKVYHILKLNYPKFIN